MFDCKRGVVVVAHCDDEVLWAGGLLARYRFDVIACSIPARDPVRAWKFFDACEALGVNGRLLPFQETPGQPLGHLEHLDLSSYDLVVSHNRHGEYGHKHHVQLNGLLKPRVVFGYGGPGSIVLKLTEDEQARKLAALRCYDHVSPSDTKPKWQALLDRYSIDIGTETFDPA